VQNRIDKACARRSGIRETVAGGSAARSRAFVGQGGRRWDMLSRKIHGGMEFRRPISAYHTKAICAVSMKSSSETSAFQ
jgi:hypothetical protein